MSVEDYIYAHLMDWSKRIYNNRSDTTTFEYEVQHQGLGELVQDLMAEAWLEGGVALLDWIDDPHSQDDPVNPYRPANQE